MSRFGLLCPAWPFRPSNLVPRDTNTCTTETVQFLTPGQCSDIFVHDRGNGATVRVNVTTSGGQANHASTDPAISADGLAVGFFSLASNLVPGDTNTCALPDVSYNTPGECPDIFVNIRR